MAGDAPTFTPALLPAIILIALHHIPSWLNTVIITPTHSMPPWIFHGALNQTPKRNPFLLGKKKKNIYPVIAALESL